MTIFETRKQQDNNIDDITFNLRLITEELSLSMRDTEYY